LKPNLFIINPASARGSTVRAWAGARRELIASGVEFDEHVTTHAGEATTVTREALHSNVTRIIAVGGDGTLGEVVNGYLDDRGVAINLEASIGLLPSGTGSDFRRSLALKDHHDFLKSLRGSESRWLDAARATFIDQRGVDGSRFFINVASFGLGGDASALVNQWREKLPRWIGGRARFAAAAIAALKRYENVDISLQLDERVIEISSNLIVVANGRYAGGGMMLAPHAQLDDELFDVILTDGITRFDVIKELRRIHGGGHLKNRKVTELKARQVSINAGKPLAIDVDGEMVGYTPASLKVLPGAIRFAV